MLWFVVKTALKIQGCFSYCLLVFTQSRLSPLLMTSHLLRVHKELGGNIAGMADRN